MKETKTLKCVLVEDDPFAKRILEQLIHKSRDLEWIASFDNATSALTFFRSGNAADVLFLDVELDGDSGIDLLKQLPYTPNVIFTTAHEQFAFVAFEMGAIDYLKKPISQERFATALKRLKKAGIKPVVNELITESASDYLFFKSGRSVIKIKTDDILFFKASKDYVKVVTTDKSNMILMTMKSIMDKLNPDQFIRINKSHIVNWSKVDRIEGDSVFISSLEIAISRSIKKEIKDRFKVL
jgi:DNA-binding LytR/AlgR family response regulator